MCLVFDWLYLVHCFLFVCVCGGGGGEKGMYGRREGKVSR